MNIKHIGKIFVFALYGSLLGAIVGIISWVFLFVVNESIHFVWHIIPETFGIDGIFYTLFLCITGGVLVGLCQKNFGEYPREMGEVIYENKVNKRVDYSNLHKGVLTGTTVLLFGASLGPEATLVGIIGGLCYWISDKLWVSREKIEPLTEKGIKAKFKYYIVNPFYSLFIVRQNDNIVKIEPPKYIKYIVYTITAIVGYWVFSKLFDLAHLNPFIINFPDATISANEWIAAIPLMILGIGLGYFYKIIGKATKYATKPLNEYKIIKATIGGVVLGIFGIIFPIILFSGEHELYELMEYWQEVPAYLLIIIGISKMFITQFCLKTGWRGGQIYPMIFAGACIGYGVSLMFSIDSVTAVAIIVTAMVCTVIKMRTLIAVVLCLFFPWELWILIGFAALAASLPEMCKKKFAKTEQNVKA